MTTLIDRFEFSLPPKEQDVKIVRKPLGFMMPMVEGRFNLGAFMPLNVRPSKA